jgi:hypothetical protein
MLCYEAPPALTLTALVQPAVAATVAEAVPGGVVDVYVRRGACASADAFEYHIAAPVSGGGGGAALYGLTHSEQEGGAARARRLAGGSGGAADDMWFVTIVPRAGAPAALSLTLRASVPTLADGALTVGYTFAGQRLALALPPPPAKDGLQLLQLAVRIDATQSDAGADPLDVALWQPPPTYGSDARSTAVLVPSDDALAVADGCGIGGGGGPVAACYLLTHATCVGSAGVPASAAPPAFVGNATVVELLAARGAPLRGNATVQFTLRATCAAPPSAPSAACSSRLCRTAPRAPNVVTQCRYTMSLQVLLGDARRGRCFRRARRPRSRRRPPSVA